MIANTTHRCTPHPYQDKTYGPNKRVFTTKADKSLVCTVCGTRQT
jgi:hypothetical protein